MQLLHTCVRSTGLQAARAVGPSACMSRIPQVPAALVSAVKAFQFLAQSNGPSTFPTSACKLSNQALVAFCAHVPSYLIS